MDTTNLLKRFAKNVFFASFVAMTTVSCNPYDEQDVTIISFLKINDLLEQQLTPESDSAIDQYNQDVEDHEQMASANLLFSLGGVGDLFSDSDDPLMKYDQNSINYIFSTIYDSEKNSANMSLLENEITTELWNYINNLYTDIIPAKAQNVEEGRYYTISELKKMYPKYAEVELEDFSPMNLINTVKNETFLGAVTFGNSNVNLRTLYIFYLYYKDGTEPVESSADLSQYQEIIASYFPDGIPDDLDVNKIMNTFQWLSTGEDPVYSNDLAGFKNFASEYFETDMFSGADTEY